MKKNLLIISALVFGAFGAKAQITITTADVAFPPALIQQAHDTLPTVSAGSSGINQTWNMTALQTHSLDSLNFIAPGWAPESAEFPGSNLAVQFSGPENAYGYASNTASSMTLLGNSAEVDFGGGLDTLVQKNTPAEILTNFPSTYLSNFTNNYVSEAMFELGFDPGVGFTIDSARQKSVVTKTSNVDAWGTITTPLGSFPSLRYHVEKRNVDSLFIKAFGAWSFFQETIDSTKQYSWWANSIGFPLVDATIDWATGAVTSVDWLKTPLTAGINVSTVSSAVNVYPNPAQNDITFMLESAKVSAVQVYDIAGRMIDSYPVSNDNLRINTSEFANGIYTFAVIGADNAIVNRGKFTVAK
ncbi:MAG TPA: T9SS type A sorting domain-containing protein [Bacteroidia bacterium]|jgi:hypothetical protein